MPQGPSPGGRPLIRYRNVTLRIGAGVALGVEAIYVGAVMASLYPSVLPMLVLSMIMALSLAGCFIATRPRVDVYPDRLDIVGYLGFRTLGWDEVSTIRICPHPLWHGRIGCVETRKGEVVPVFAVETGRFEGSSYRRALRVVAELE